MVSNSISRLGNLAEERYILQQCAIHRKKFGQFFTPDPIASFMMDWVLGIEPANMLEPAFGLGVFSRICMDEYQRKPQIKACEKDPEMFSLATELFAPYPNVVLENEDYIFHDWDSKYEAIVCNPPYLKFHDYDNRAVLSEIQYHTGYKFSLSSNLYTMFIIKAIFQMAKGGRASFIVPTEFLNSNYGVAIKKFLLDTGVLRYIFVIDFNSTAFSKVLTTSSILLLENDKTADSFLIVEMKDANALNKYKDLISSGVSDANKVNYYRYEDINPNEKWSKYYRSSNPTKASKLVPFNHFAQVKRGIATGDNDYFTFDKNKALKYNIPSEALLQCITKASHAPGKVFSIKDFQTLTEENKRVFLFNGKSMNTEPVLKYLALGVEKEVNKKYLTSKRKPWYRLENRTPADFWIGVFNRNKPRFILNQAQVRNLTAFHSVYIKYPDEQIRTLFMAYLLSDLAIKMLETNNREYGNGLKKFEPNDVNHSLVPDVASMNKNSKQMLMELLNRFIQSTETKEPDYPVLDKITEVFENEFDISF